MGNETQIFWLLTITSQSTSHTPATWLGTQQIPTDCPKCGQFWFQQSRVVVINQQIPIKCHWIPGSERRLWYKDKDDFLVVWMAQTHEPEKMKRTIIEGWMKYNAGTCSEGATDVWRNQGFFRGDGIWRGSSIGGWGVKGRMLQGLSQWSMTLNKMLEEIWALRMPCGRT